MINYSPPAMEQLSDTLEKFYVDEISQGKVVRELTLQITEDCCMACTYCYQHHKKSTKMTFEMAKNIIDKLLNEELNNINKENTLAIFINFIGGEPFMNVELMDKICDYLIKQLINLKHPWLYHLKLSICSNGLLYFTPKVQEFFIKYNGFCDFNISIDGNKELHDKCRIDLNGQGTYDRAIAAAKDFQAKYGFMPSTKMTLAPDNIEYLTEALINLINEGYFIIPFNCIFESGWTYEHATILYYKLKEVANYLIYNNLYNKVNIRMFSEHFYQPLSEENNDNWCGGVNSNSIAIDAQGDIFPCIRYMESSLNGKQPALILGNISHGMYQTEIEKTNFKLIANITRRSQSIDECFYCPIAAGCSWCSGFNYEEFGTPNKRATYICCMHQAQALANVYYWNTLYKYLNIDKVFICHLPKDKALNIISEKEYNYLLNLIE